MQTLIQHAGAYVHEPCTHLHVQNPCALAPIFISCVAILPRYSLACDGKKRPQPPQRVGDEEGLRGVCVTRIRADAPGGGAVQRRQRLRWRRVFVSLWCGGWRAPPFCVAVLGYSPPSSHPQPTAPAAAPPLLLLVAALGCWHSWYPAADWHLHLALDCCHDWHLTAAWYLAAPATPTRPPSPTPSPPSSHPNYR